MPADPNNPNFPSFDELPFRKGDPGKSCWGFWPENDQFGMLNLLTPERILAAKKEITTGQVASLKYLPRVLFPSLYLFQEIPFWEGVLFWRQVFLGLGVNCSWRMQNPEYPGFGRQPIQHRVFPTYKGKPVNDDELVFNTQSGTPRCKMNVLMHRESVGRIPTLGITGESIVLEWTTSE